MLTNNQFISKESIHERSLSKQQLDSQISGRIHKLEGKRKESPHNEQRGCANKGGLTLGGGGVDYYGGGGPFLPPSPKGGRYQWESSGMIIVIIPGILCKAYSKKTQI